MCLCPCPTQLANQSVVTLGDVERGEGESVGDTGGVRQSGGGEDMQVVPPLAQQVGLSH